MKIKRQEIIQLEYFYIHVVHIYSSKCCICLFPSFVTNQNMTVIPGVTLPEILNCIFQSTPCYNTTNNCMMHPDTSSIVRSYSLQHLHIKCQNNTKVNSVLKISRTVFSTHKCLKSYDVKSGTTAATIRGKYTISIMHRNNTTPQFTNLI
jgi:hypothetical protein